MASFLTIDAGNTHLKWALFEDHKLVRTEQDDQLCEGCPLKLLLQTLLPQAAIVADVANRLPELQRLLSDRLPLLVLDHHTALPFVNAYQTPHTLGKDRLSVASGANFLFPKEHCLVVDAGTCLKFDLMLGEGKYLGGSIAPGLVMRFRALQHFTARLPLGQVQDFADLIGATTAEAIAAGVLMGIVEECNGMVKRYTERYPNLRILLTGGDTPQLQPHLDFPHTAIPHLVHYGLYHILQHHHAA